MRIRYHKVASTKIQKCLAGSLFEFFFELQVLGRRPAIELLSKYLKGGVQKMYPQLCSKNYLNERVVF